jgi:hypothetical protein
VSVGRSPGTPISRTTRRSVLAFRACGLTGDDHGPVERHAVTWEAREPGYWLCHCPIHHHATNDGREEHGGGGLMLILNVT